MKEGIQKKYVELQLVAHQLEQVKNQVAALDVQSNEMGLVGIALDDFSKAKRGSNMFVTLTPGLFVKAELVEENSVLLNVGAGAMVQKTISEAKELVVDQERELKKLHDELSVQALRLEEHVKKLQSELSSLVK